MGVKLKDLFETKKTSYEQLAHKRIAIDAFNMLYQFLTTIRMQDGTPLKNSKGNITSHLVGLLARCTNMLEHNIKPIFIYDGTPPELKRAERERRKELKEEAQKKYAQAIQEQDGEQMKKYAGRTVQLTADIISESKELLTALGIPWIQAPSEAEAQAAYIVQRGDADYSASQDYDSLLFGTPKLIRNLGISGKRKRPGSYGYIQIEPEIIVLEEELKRLHITQKQLILLGMIIGTDFNIGGIQGLGPKKGLMKIKEHGEDMDALFADIGWKSEYTYQDVYNTLADMPVTETYTTTQKNIDEQYIHDLLVKRFEFNPQRVQQSIERIQTRSSQKGLAEFF